MSPPISKGKGQYSHNVQWIIMYVSPIQRAKENTPVKFSGSYCMSTPIPKGKGEYPHKVQWIIMYVSPYSNGEYCYKVQCNKLTYDWKSQEILLVT